MKNIVVEKGFILDLSSVTNNSQLVSELSSLMEHPEVKGKNICLKLGKLDLSQSQLLSIKALVESMDAEIASIETKSEQTEASAINLGLNLSSASQGTVLNESSTIVHSDEKTENIDIVEDTTDLSVSEDDEFNNSKSVEVYAEIAENSPIENVSDTEDICDDESLYEIAEIIPSDDYGNNFENLALSEGLISQEDASKYILLDTEDVIECSVEESTANTENMPTLYINQTLRSGQTITYEGNIFIIGDAHPGSEIVAEGDITVWGILSGIAHAGNKGNVTAKVRALKLNAIQLRIANMYARRNDTLNVPYVQKTNEFTPEEALIENEKIVIYKKLRRN